MKEVSCTQNMYNSKCLEKNNADASAKLKKEDLKK